MNTIERNSTLEKQEQKTKDGVRTLKNILEPKHWVCSVNTGYKELRIRAWEEGDSIGTPCRFVIEEDHVKLMDAGTYQESWKEAETVINRWWSKRFIRGKDISPRNKIVLRYRLISCSF